MILDDREKQIATEKHAVEIKSFQVIAITNSGDNFYEVL